MCWPSKITQLNVEVETTQPAAKESIKEDTMENPKILSTLVFAFAMVTLLSWCSPVSCFFTYPRVTRTHDALIIDLTGVGYAPFFIGRGYGQIANPGYILNPSFDPYGLFYNGWSHFGRQAAAPAAASASATVQCGKGPADFTLPDPPGPPPARSFLTERVLGGNQVPATTNPWPFLVSLRKNSDDPDVYFCSGSLISDTKVLLAAQCLEKLSMNQISDVTVWVGVVGAPPNLNAPMTRKISKIVIHGQYNALTFANDIAIITMDSPVVFSRIVSPVCLAPASTEIDQYADKRAAIMGWGLAGKLTAVTAATDFNQGRVTIGSNIECNSDPNVAPFFTNNNVCLRTGGSTAFTCADDIGGPVVINTADNRLGVPAVWTQVGINSFTPGTCDSNGLKTRVSAFRSWINTYMA